MINLELLFQIDATIIAGAIILLTITSFVGKKDHEPIGIPIKNKAMAFTPHQVASGTIFAFGISALCIMLNSEDLAYASAAIGFGWLIFSAFIIAAKEQFDNTSNNKK